MCHTAEKLRKGTLLFSENLGYRKILCIIGGYHNFPSKNFLSHSAEKFFGEPFSVPLISGIEKFYAWEGYVTIFCQNFLSHSSEKFRKGTLQCFTNFGYQKTLEIYRKKNWHDRDSNSEPTAWEPCCPNPTAVIYFWIKRVGNIGLKKKEKRPYWMNNFSCILHMLRKIIMLTPTRA